MNNYDDSQRRDDAFALSKRDRTEMSEAEQVLAVVLSDGRVRPLLDVLDPMVVDQARKAMRL